MTERSDIKSFFLHPHASTMIEPVCARAAESRKVSPLLKDEKAEEIEKSIKAIQGIVIQDNRGWNHYALISKTICFDRLIKDFIWRHPGGTIINIGCALDTTFERLGPESIRWYDVDLPENITLRKLFFAENEQRKFISSVFLKGDWIRDISFRESLLVFSSDAFYYYNENQIRQFFEKLCFSFPSFELLFGITSSAGLRAANKRNFKVGITRSPMLKWSIKDYRTVLKWNPRMVFLGKYGFILNGVGRPPFRYLIRSLISDAISISQILHLRVRYNYRSINSFPNKYDTDIHQNSTQGDF